MDMEEEDRRKRHAFVKRALDLDECALDTFDVEVGVAGDVLRDNVEEWWPSSDKVHHELNLESIGVRLGFRHLIS
jgi:hypothetical protein